MHEIATVLPQEVLDFIAKCRKQIYPLDAKPNYPTGNSYESGFLFKRKGLIYTDISTEQHGRFSGTEQVELVSTNPKLNGQRIYICHYAGGNTAEAAHFGDVVNTAQHSFVIDYPNLVRFGSKRVALIRMLDGIEFNYSELGDKFPWGYLNREIMSAANSDRIRKMVYSGSSQITVFEVK